MNSRPKIRDCEVIEEASKKVHKDILEWLKDWGEESDDENVAMNIARQAAEEASHGKNGYEIAKSIEDDFMVNPDPELVEILDGIHSDLHSCKDAITKKWVEENLITCPYEVGDIVSFSHCHHPMQGKIYEIDKNRAKCIIFVEGMSFKPIIQYEDMVLVQKEEQ